MKLHEIINEALSNERIRNQAYAFCKLNELLEREIPIGVSDCLKKLAGNKPLDKDILQIFRSTLKEIYNPNLYDARVGITEFIWGTIYISYQDKLKQYKNEIEIELNKPGFATRHDQNFDNDENKKHSNFRKEVDGRKGSSDKHYSSLRHSS